MSRFLKVAGESVWINLDQIEGLMIRPELKAVGPSRGEGQLEELHEITGQFELTVMLRGQLHPVATFPTKAEAEARVHELLGSQLVQ